MDTSPSDPHNVVDLSAFRNRGEPERPARRPLKLRPPRAEPTRYRLRVELVDAEVPLWRLISTPSDIALDRLHEAIQATFGWTNSHLHRFTLTDDRYGDETDGILTRFDVEEGEPGILESEIRLDQVLDEPGATLNYTYDFGDDWHHRVTLEKLSPLDDTDATIRCLDGRRAAPPEDVGGIHWYEHLREVAAEPRHPEYAELREQIDILGLGGPDEDFDVDAANRALARLGSRRVVLDRLLLGGRSPLTAMVIGLGDDARAHLAGFLADARLEDPIEVDEAAAAVSTRVLRTFLAQIPDAGIRLTGAGYLPPLAVRALMAELDPDRIWIGERNREAQTQPLLELREIATALGLVRKYRGELRLTKVGAALREDPVALWHHVSGRLPLEKSHHGSDVALLLLILVASGEATPWERLQESIDLLTAMVGWQFEGYGRYGNAGAIYHARETRQVLNWAGAGVLLERMTRPDALGQPGARLLARAALATALATVRA